MNDNSLLNEIPNLFEILELRESDIFDEGFPKKLKTNWKQLSLLHHPDRAGGKTERFTLIQNAYEILSDVEQRKTYMEMWDHSKRTGIDHFGLKKRHQDWVETQPMTPMTPMNEETKKKSFDEQTKELNRKHMFNDGDAGAISQADANQRFNQMRTERLTQDSEEVPVKLFEKLDQTEMEKFHKVFDEIHRRENDMIRADGLPAAFNGASTSVTPFAYLDNVGDLYANDEAEYEIESTS